MARRSRSKASPTPSSRSSSPASRTALLERLRAEQERRRRNVTARFTVYRDDPIGFIDKALLGFVWSKQREICLSVRDNRRTAVKSCHDVGKSAIAARVAAWWISAHEPGESFVVSLAPTAHQVKAILWREINKVHQAGGLPGHCNMTEWYIGNELVAFGRSPKDTDPTAIQGVHAAAVLLIIDEACGVAKALIDAADSLIANDASRALAIGNPDDPATEFAEICKPGSGWNVLRISAFDSPNFTGEAVPDWLRPLLISKTWVEEKRKRWGESSPLYTSKVLGEFPEQSADSLIPLTALNSAVGRQLPSAPDSDRIELGVDVARFGDDHTVIVARHGSTARRLHKENNRDLMFVAGLVVKAIRDTGAKRVKIDDIGLGGGVTDRLNELKREGTGEVPFDCEIIGVNVGEGATSDDEDVNGKPASDERFINLRAELNWNLRERFIASDIALEGDNLDELLSQAGQIKYLYSSRGKIAIERKRDMKKRTKGVSPDDWDALVLAFAEPAGGFDVGTFARAYS